MSSRFPYHYCAAPGCVEMTPESAEFCLCHVVGLRLVQDTFFPGAEALIAGPTPIYANTAASSDAAPTGKKTS